MRVYPASGAAPTSLAESAVAALAADLTDRRFAARGLTGLALQRAAESGADRRAPRDRSE